MAMIRTACLLLVIHTGCSRPATLDGPAVQPPEAAPAAIPPLAVSSGEESIATNAELTGRAFERAVAPDRPALPPIERFDVAPRPRTVSIDPVESITSPKARVLRAALRPVESAGLRPAPPPERVSPDLGAGATAAPAKPKLPVAAGRTKRSRDVNLPPPLPLLGRQASDRVGFDDPTTDLSTSMITGPSAKPPIVQAPFLKLGIPNPFELAEQIMPAIPPAAEPGLSPVPVNPRRVK
jgi:hypothetical protein